MHVFQLFFLLQSTKTINGKKKMWRSLKQITTQERNLPWPDNTINCKYSILKNKLLNIDLYIC